MENNLYRVLADGKDGKFLVFIVSATNITEALMKVKERPEVGKVISASEDTAVLIS